MGRPEREILERAVHSLAEQAAKADAIVDEAIAAGLDGSHPLTVQAKTLSQELLQTKADLERELGTFVLDYSACGQTVHWVGGLGVAPRPLGRTGEPAPHGEPCW
jgi:hypothetical protein